MTRRMCSNGVSLTIEPGRITCLLGSNGSGKTTLIRSILGLTPARAGRITFDGQDITAAADPQGHRRRRGLHSRRPQGVSEIHGRGEPAARRLSGKLGYRHAAADGRRSTRCSRAWPSAARQLAGTMSGGEQAMVSIGRGLMRAPKLLLIDEPSLGLSPLLVQENFRIIRTINERGITIFLVEQNVHQTLAIAHYGYVVRRAGSLRADAARNWPAATKCVRPISVKRADRQVPSPKRVATSTQIGLPITVGSDQESHYTSLRLSSAQN